ncbi:MAG: thiamine pyrophosphate-dependent enzyme, partial [Hyphomicrobiales bacterium]
EVRRGGVDKDALSKARAPVLIAGGGVIYSGAEAELLTFAQAHQIPIVETQSGKGALTNDEPLNLGGLGVTGTSAANLAVARADVIVAVGTRLQDFTTGSRALLGNDDTALIGLNIQPFDAAKLKATPLVADARTGLAALSGAIGDYRAPREWGDAVQSARDEWRISAKTVTAPTNTARPTDAQVIGAVQASLGKTDIVVGAAGGLPGELHKLWNTTAPGGYHMEYGYSCMGYEIAGGIGVKMANPTREVVVMLGDGSYLMANSEIATSVSLNLKLIIVLLDNRGFGCINRLQGATGGAPFNNLLDDAASHVDFAAHAASLGAISTHAASLNELEAAIARARDADRTSVIVIDTDPNASTQDGGTWWDVAVPEVSTRPQVTKARAAYEAAIIARQRGENDV